MSSQAESTPAETRIDRLSPDSLVATFSQSHLLKWFLLAFLIHAIVIGGFSIGNIRDLLDPEGAKARKEAAIAAVHREGRLRPRAVIAVGVATLRGAGDMVAGLVSMSVVNLVNAGASFALAAGVLGLPRLGWRGLAWGTLLGYVVGACCTLLLLVRRDRLLRPGMEIGRAHV